MIFGSEVTNIWNGKNNFLLRKFIFTWCVNLFIVLAKFILHLSKCNKSLIIMGNFRVLKATLQKDIKRIKLSLNFEIVVKKKFRCNLFFAHVFYGVVEVKLKKLKHYSKQLILRGKIKRIFHPMTDNGMKLSRILYMSQLYSHGKTVEKRIKLKRIN